MCYRHDNSWMRSPRVGLVTLNNANILSFINGAGTGEPASGQQRPIAEAVGPTAWGRPQPSASTWWRGHLSLGGARVLEPSHLGEMWKLFTDPHAFLAFCGGCWFYLFIPPSILAMEAVMCAKRSPAHAGCHGLSQPVRSQRRSGFGCVWAFELESFWTCFGRGG